MRDPSYRFAEAASEITPSGLLVYKIRLASHASLVGTVGRFATIRRLLARTACCRYPNQAGNLSFCFLHLGEPKHYQALPLSGDGNPRGCEKHAASLR